ncbi:steroid 5-alpha-reductase det2 [Anaeramoeba flamelloides]|uniref:Steroid 5-alpha-reductase det2 n=1 Tax=Anaeramoeba flamelloides TaxID=1746091 RepID=A0ABQ8Z8P9_9EUKA|nr:steroid 5-alpha-reductase det2 [Anaeramoeba flamelloides]
MIELDQNTSSIILAVFGICSAVILIFTPAYYGKFAPKKRTLFMINSSSSWFIFEVVSPAMFIYTYLKQREGPLQVNFIAVMYLTHYFLRTFIYPFVRISKGKSSKTPLEITIMAMISNTFIGNANGHGAALKEMDGSLCCSFGCFKDPLFVVGFLLFWIGMAINWHSESVLRSLRKGGKKTYSIPYGGLFKYVSCAHYFGELLEWTGYAIASRTIGSIIFTLFTAFNLVPRAVKTHKWYHEKFEDYPKERKILIPKII